MPDKIILIDSNSLIHRAYHALPNLKSTKGMYTGAIFGFLTILLRLIKQEAPTHIAAAFDLKAPTFRHKMFDGYKATRKPMDAELAMQVEPLKDLLRAMGIKVVSVEGYEADDILGTLSRRFDGPTIVLTGDRDSFQLVSDTTRVFWTKKGVSEVEIYDEARLLQDGFTPKQFIDYKALMGDPSDNIPGVAGVGEKTAKQLLQTYKTLDEVLDHAEEIKGKVGQTIAASRDIALLSRELATINDNVPVDCSLDDIVFKPVFSREVKNMLAELEIVSLASRMEFEAEEGKPQENKITKTVVELKTVEEIKKAAIGDRIAVIVDDNISFACDRSREYRINCIQDLFSEGVSFDEAIEVLKDIVKDKELVCYDYKALSKKHGIKTDKFFDIMIAAHLARGSAPIKSLDAVLGSEGMETGAVELLVAADMFAASLSAQQLDKLFYELEQPLAVVLGKMEERGFAVDPKRLDVLKDKYSKQLESLAASIYEIAGCTFNIASPKQLGEILFDKMGLKHGKKNKTGYSVNEDVLLGLMDESPVVDLILKWRHYAKLLSTYVTGMQALITRGRIHTEFNQCITTTGRLSSTNPNLQNIPVRGDEAKDVKSAFIAGEGKVLVSADYSQIELRLLAHFSGDENLIEAYKRADDIHALTAAQILGVDMRDVTPAQRREAKAVNFGIIYGMSDFGLAENLSIPVYKAKQFIEKYFETYPKVRAYLDKNISDAKENGYSVTMLGRRRNLVDITASNYLVRSAAERMAMNTPLQGSAADIMKVAMLGVEKRLEGMESRMILQVHDELIIETVEREKSEVIKLLCEEMEHAADLKVPLVAEGSSGCDWGDLK